MKRRKEHGLKSLYKSFELPFTIIAVLLLVYTGKVVVGIVPHAEHYQKIMENNEGDVIGGGSEEKSENGEPIEEEKGETIVGERESEEKNENGEPIEEEREETIVGEGESEEKNENEKATEGEKGETTVEEEGQEGSKEDLAKNVTVTALEDLANSIDTTTWRYERHLLGGTLYLLSDADYVLQNVENGTATQTVPIHIIVDTSVSDINITLNNVDISRPIGINDSLAVLPVNSEANGVIFVSNANVTITLNGENTINGNDNSANGGTFPTSVVRSTIYLYVGETDIRNTLTIKGSGKLTSVSAGINSFATAGATSRIVIDEGEINVDISGRTDQVGIGGTTFNRGITNTGYGSLSVEITGGTVNVKIQMSLISGRQTLSAAAIGTGTIGGSLSPGDDSGDFDNLNIVINGTADVNIEVTFGENVAGGSAAVGITGAMIGTGSHSGDIESINIEIGGGARITINRTLVKGTNAPNDGTAGIYGAAIGTGSMSSVSRGAVVKDIVIKISETAYVEIDTLADSNKNADGAHDITLNGPNIGIGSTNLARETSYSYSYNNVVITTEGNPIVNINMIGRRTGNSTVNANVPVIGVGSGVQSSKEHIHINIHGGTIRSHLKIDDESGTSAGEMNVNFTGIGPGFDNVFDEFNINITGGELSIKNEINSPNNDNVILGAGIGESSSSSSSVNSKMNINISGNAKIHVEGGEVGIGATATSHDEVNVDIKKDKDGNIPSIFATAREGLAIVENNGGGITTNVMISQLNLGDDRSGVDWPDWDDTKEKKIEVQRDSDGEVIRKAEVLPPGVKSVAYSVPEIDESTKTNILVSFDSIDNRYFVDPKRGDNIIFADINLVPVDVVFRLYTPPLDLPLPALRTLHNGVDSSLERRSWSYERSLNGGTLRLTGQGDFDIRNIESRHVDEEGSVPMHIIVESGASGSTLSFTNVNVSRSDTAQSDTGVLNRDDEAIATFVIKAADTEIVLTEGSTNIIDGADASLTDEGYRTAIYLYNSEASIVNLTVKASGTNETPSLITLNGGINALGASGATVNMNLDDAIYNLSAVGRNTRNGVAFGSSFVDGTVNFDLKLNLRNASYVRAIGDTVAIGHNQNIGMSDLNIIGAPPKIEAIAFTHDDVLSSKKLSSTSLGFRTTLNSGDNWESVIMRPYGGEYVGSTFWEVMLPVTSIYPNTAEQDISVVYSNPEIAAFNEASPFERMTMRIVRQDEENKLVVNFLANVDGTGSTTPLILTGVVIENLNTMLPDDGAINIPILDILLETDMNQRTFNMINNEVRNIINNSSLPLSMSYRYSLGEMPDGVKEGNFATDSSDFEEVDGNEVEKILLGIVIDEVTGSSDVNIAVQTPPLFPMEEDTFTDIAVLRGAHNGVTSAVDLSVTGRFTEAMGRNITGEFISTIHLRWSREEFVQFS